MNAQSIASQITTFSSQAFKTNKMSVLWLGHTIKVNFSRYGIPVAEKLSQLALIAFSYFQKLLRSRPGFIFIAAGGVLLLGITAFKLADRKDYEENMLAKTAWKSVGIIAFISATALTSLGMTTLLTI